MSCRAAEDQVREALELAEQNSAQAREATSRVAELESRAAAAESAAAEAKSIAINDSTEMLKQKQEIEVLQAQLNTSQLTTTETLYVFHT